MARKNRSDPLGINRGPYETPGSALIDLHYAKLRIDQRWTWDRFLRLAGFLRVTPGELASLVRLKHTLLEGCHLRNQFPPPVALLLTLIEAHVSAEIIPDVIKTPFPNLSSNG